LLKHTIILLSSIDLHGRMKSTLELFLILPGGIAKN